MVFPTLHWSRQITSTRPWHSPFLCLPRGSQCSQSHMLSSLNLPLPWRLSPSNLANQCPCIPERRLGTSFLPFFNGCDSRNSTSLSYQTAFHGLSLFIFNSVCLVNSYSSFSVLFRQRVGEGSSDHYNGLCPLDSHPSLIGWIYFLVWFLCLVYYFLLFSLYCVCLCTCEILSYA